MRRLLPLLAVLSLLVASSSLSLAGPGVARAATLSIDVVGTGAEQNPAVSSAGSAIARFTFDTDTKELTYAVTVSGISQTQVTAAHIHRAGAGTNGPVAYPLSTGPFAITSGSIALTSEDVADLSAGNFYLNVHSLTNPGGFARAQIVFPGLEWTDASGSTVTPPSTGDAGLADKTTSTAWLALSGLVALGLGASLIFARRRA